MASHITTITTIVTNPTCRRKDIVKLDGYYLWEEMCGAIIHPSSRRCGAISYGFVTFVYSPTKADQSVHHVKIIMKERCKGRYTMDTLSKCWDRCSVAGKRRTSVLNVTGSRPPLATRRIRCWSISQISWIYFRGYWFIYVIINVDEYTELIT